MGLRRVRVDGQQIAWHGWFHRFADIHASDGRVVTMALVENESGHVEKLDLRIHELTFVENPTG